jgi:serine/threonine-protein phosphatase 5
MIIRCYFYYFVFTRSQTKKSPDLISMSSICPCLWGPGQPAKEAEQPRQTAYQKTDSKRAPVVVVDKKKRKGLTALWTALEKEDENNFLDQNAVIERAAPALRARFSEAPDQTSAVSVSAAAGLTADCEKWGSEMHVPANYEGPHLKWPITLENIRSVAGHIRTAPKYPLHQKYVAELLGKSVALFKQQVQDSVFDMSVPPRGADGALGKVVVCGDTHGHLEDFLYVLQQNGEPSSRVSYLLNGDIADRGNFASEILIICLLYKQLYPDAVMINRGNHENMEINRRKSVEGGGFYDEVCIPSMTSAGGVGH